MVSWRKSGVTWIRDEAKRGKKAGKARATPSKKKGGKKNKRAAADSDSDEFELGSEADDDDEESFKGDTESEIEGDSDFDEEPKKKKGGKKAAASSKKGAKKGATKKEDKKPAAAKGKKAAPDSIQALCAAKAKDIKVLNNPQQFPEAGPYVEPVGIDATDGIVEGIIGGMVQKVGKLLLKTLKRKDDERELGELNFPIKLNTACSGTDAPSIALGLVKESLDRFVSHSQEGTDGSDEDGDEKMKDDGEKNKKKEHGFDYEHNMSCEIEPFKQAYIGRNFPGVLLFPDITKLTEKETVVDVYGRDQHVPEGKCWWHVCALCYDVVILWWKTHCDRQFFWCVTCLLQEIFLWLVHPVRILVCWSLVIAKVSPNTLWSCVCRTSMTWMLRCVLNQFTSCFDLI